MGVVMEEEVLPEVLSSTNVSVSSNDQTIEARALMQPFEAELAKLDEVKGFSLYKTWKECLRVHDQNAVLRANLLQVESMLVAESVQWAQQRQIVAEKIAEIDRDDPDFVSKTKELLSLNDQIIKNIPKLNRTIRDIRKEIRSAEFQSSYLFHLNTVHFFTTSLAGLLQSKLQGDPKLQEILEGMRRIAKIFGAQEARDMVTQELKENGGG
jgi:hypothetical protein